MNCDITSEFNACSKRNSFIIILIFFRYVKYFKFRPTEFQDDKVGLRTKRISTFLIVLFIVPSIWSAVILIKQNNFEEKAVLFAESSKAYGRSIIYDYKIDHAEGGIVELFFTGEQLSDEARSFMYKEAENYGIKPEQIRINDHTISESGNDIELVKGIYDRMDQEIGKRDADIVRLKQELDLARKEELPYLQLTKEIISTYPSVKEVHLAQGAAVTADSLAVSRSILVMVTAEESFTESDSVRLHQWLKIRLETDEVSMWVR